MGYRSDVAYTIRFTTEEAYRLFILEAKSNGLGSCFSDDYSVYDEAECNDEQLRIDFHAVSVKWYESYPDVQMHEKLLAQAREWVDSDHHVSIKDGEPNVELTPHRIGWAFVRVGEDTEDVVEEHGGFADWDWLHVTRSIERN